MLVLVALLWLAPGFWALVTSFKITPMILEPVPFWLPIPATLDQYVGVLSGTRSAAMTIAIWNSTLVSVLTTLATVAVCALTAYPLARMTFPGRDILFARDRRQHDGAERHHDRAAVPADGGAWLVEQLSGPHRPEHLLRVWRLPLASVLPEHACRARRRGPHRRRRSWQIFTRLLLPLSQPGLVALALFTFQLSWNDFTWPLIVMTKAERLTLPVALSLIRGNYQADSFGPIMAGAVISAIPLLVIFLVANRQIIEGVQFSGLKV